MTVFPRPKIRWRTALVGYLFISPWLIGFVVFTVGPLLVSLGYSFTNITVFKPGAWIGLDNYIRLLDDPLVGIALWNTFFYTALFVPLVNVLALTIAALLNGAGKRFSFLRTIYFLPSLMGSVVVAVVWRYLFGTNYGLVNAGLEAVGLARIDWLGDPLWTKPALIVMNLWSFGGLMLINLAAIQQVPHEILDAAQLDGASRFARWRYIVLPFISPVLFFNIVVSVIGTLQIFTPAYIFSSSIIGTAGPDNSLLFYVLYLFRRAFRGQFELGYASALGWVLLIVIALLTFAQFRLRRRTTGDDA
jgi:multiple sugar transport system permease protein